MRGLGSAETRRAAENSRCQLNRSTSILGKPKLLGVKIPDAHGQVLQIPKVGFVVG